LFGKIEILRKTKEKTDAPTGKKGGVKPAGASGLNKFTTGLKPALKKYPGRKKKEE
jgi:hypothetical protein